MRRAAVSIPSNIAEGKGRSSDRELVQFLNHARGSLYELQTQIKLAAGLSYIAPADKITSQAEEVGKVLNGLIRRFRDSDLRNARPDGVPGAESPEPAFKVIP